MIGCLLQLDSKVGFVRLLFQMHLTHLNVEVYNVVFVHVLEALQELSNVSDGLCFAHRIAIIGDSIKQFTTGKATVR